MARTGRPSKLTPELLEEFERSLRRVLYVSIACDMVGIDRSTYYVWRNRAQAEIDRVAEDPRRSVRKDEALYVEFFDACERARHEGAGALLDQIHAAVAGEAPGDWKAAAWMLERAFPRDWGKQQKVEHSGSVSYRIEPPKVLGGDE